MNTLNKAVEASKFLLTLVDVETGECMTNLKLQKLLYYSQGFILAILNKKLFEDPIEAWPYGPVVPTVYDIYKQYEKNPIPVEHLNGDFSIFTDNEKNIMTQVYSEYGQYSAWKLAEMTHEEMPWKSTPSRHVITEDKLKSHFSTLVQ